MKSIQPRPFRTACQGKPDPSNKPDEKCPRKDEKHYRFLLATVFFHTIPPHIKHSSLLFPIMGPALYDFNLLPIYPEHYAVLSVNSKAPKPRKIAR